MLRRLRKRLQGAGRPWVGLFALVWLAAVYPTCTTAQQAAPEAASAQQHGEHAAHGHHHAVDPASPARATDSGCIGDDCPIFAAIDNQAAPKLPTDSDGDLKPPLSVLAPLWRLPLAEIQPHPDAERFARTSPPASFPPPLEFRVLLI